MSIRHNTQYSKVQYTLCNTMAIGAVFGVMVDVPVVVLMLIGGTPTDYMLRYLSAIYSIYIVRKYRLPFVHIGLPVQYYACGAVLGGLSPYIGPPR